MPILLLFLLAIAASTQPPSPTANALAQAQTTYPPFTKSLETIFTSLPTEVNLQNMIYTADAVALTKLIQVIELKEQSIPCDALGVYTESIIGMIKSAKHRKELLIAQMDVIYESAKSQIARIEKQLERLNNQKNSLHLSELRDNILNTIIELDYAYGLINKDKNTVEGFQAQIIGYMTDISLKEKDSNEKRSILIEKKLQISGLDTQIFQLEQKLADLRQQRTIVKKDAENLQKKIEENTKYIQTTRQKISGIEYAIEKANIQLDDNKRRVAELQVGLERLRTQLNTENTKNDIISKQIEALKRELTIQEERFLQREHDALVNMIKVWGLLLPKFEELSATIYYNCYGDGSVDALKTGNVNVYILNGANIPEYIFNNYGLQTFAENSNFRSNYQFYVVDIFGRSWTSKYGQPFSQTPSFLNSSDLYAEQDFSCLNPSQVQSGRGTITGINKNSISIQNKDQQYIELKIGACSRIEATNVLPKIGQTIYYKGISIGESINLYTASCF